MIRWVLRLVANGLVFMGVSQLLPGFQVADLKVGILAAVVFGFVNAFIRPVLGLLSLPITFATLGLFLLVLNAGMMGLAAYLVPGFTITGFGAALGGWLLVSVGSGITNWIFKKDDDE
jgi:putative membrane protein